MSLFPLPAIIFLCCLILLLITLAILYFTVLKKGITCCCMEGHADNGEDARVENGGETNGNANGNVTTETEQTGEVTGADGGGTEGGTNDTTDGGGGGGGEGNNMTTVNALIGAISTPMTIAPPAGSVAGEGGGTATHDPGGGSQAGGMDEEPAAEEPLCIAGKILIQFTYMPAANKINLTVIRVGEMPPPERGGAENIQVHLCVLPMRKQRYRTKPVPVSKGVFNQTFPFIHMTVDLVETCAIRLRVYGAQRFSRRLIGEVKVPLSSVDLTSPLADEQIWRNLNPKGLVALYYGIDEEDEPDLDDW